MPGNPKQKQKLLHIAEYLNHCSDSENPRTVDDIIAYLARQDITAERKSIYNDVKVLIEFGMPIERAPSPRRGYYVTRSSFELSELVMLMDAVRSSPVISKERTRALNQKLLGMATISQAEQIRRRFSGSAGVETLVKSDNEEFFRNVEVINSAIASGMRIRFLYHRRMLMNNLPVFDTGREFVISPYAVVWHRDKYYTIGNYDKYDDLSHYRLDRMKQVTVTQEPARPLSEFSEYKKGFDADNYIRSISNMFADTSAEVVELECDIRLLDDIIERFGINIQFKQYTPESFNVKVRVSVSEGFEQWLLGYGGMMTVRSPEYLRQSIKKRLLDMAARY